MTNKILILARAASILLCLCSSISADDVIAGISTADDVTTSDQTIAKAFDDMIAKRLSGNRSSNAVPFSSVKTCSPIEFSTLKSTFARYGDLNPNYVAMTQEEASLFPNLFWESKKKKKYVSIIKIMKRRILRWARKNLRKISNFRRMLLRKLRLPLGRFKPVAFTNSTGKRSLTMANSVTTIRGCYDAGSIDSITQNSRICTSCMATTVLPENRFPRYINEVICKASAPVCFQGEGFCKQGRFSMTFMQKTGNCIPITQNGKTVYIEEWVPSPQSIGTCCECQIRPTSWLRQML